MASAMQLNLRLGFLVDLSVSHFRGKQNSNGFLLALQTDTETIKRWTKHYYHECFSYGPTIATNSREDGDEYFDIMGS